jgi:hypothetical protein
MKKVNLDDGICGNKSEEKVKAKTEKKQKKKKGEDFIDYANKNGIELKLVYEERANQRDEKRNVANPKVIDAPGYKKQKKSGNRGDKPYNGEGKKFQKSYNKTDCRFDLHYCNILFDTEHLPPDGGSSNLPLPTHEILLSIPSFISVHCRSFSLRLRQCLRACGRFILYPAVAFEPCGPGAGGHGGEIARRGGEGSAGGH